MKPWAWLLLVLPGGCVVLLILWLRHRAAWHEQSYPQQLDGWWKLDPQIQPLALPAVQPLKGRGLDRFPVREFSRKVSSR